MMNHLSKRSLHENFSDCFGPDRRWPLVCRRNPLGQTLTLGSWRTDDVAKVANIIAAFNKGDAKAVAALWTEDGDYTDEAGRTFKGREAIEKEFAAQFKNLAGAKLRINVKSIHFVTPEVAVRVAARAFDPHHVGAVVGEEP